MIMKRFTTGIVAAGLLCAVLSVPLAACSPGTQRQEAAQGKGQETKRENKTSDVTERVTYEQIPYDELEAHADEYKDKLVEIRGYVTAAVLHTESDPDTYAIVILCDDKSSFMAYSTKAVYDESGASVGSEVVIDGRFYWFIDKSKPSGLGVLADSIKVVDGDKQTTQEQSDAEAQVPTEYKNALEKAKRYNKIMHMSKQGLYDQLTSEYGEKFSAEAAQYAIDNLDADYNANALAKAKEYESQMAMSPSAIYDQLVSDYGEKFTEEEAQYAIDNL